MEDSQIFKGVLDGDKEFLFSSRIEQDLSEVKRELKRLEGEIEKYERLIATLDLLPRELSWSLPHIALTKHALLPNAELTNTNEVTVHIGDNWFTKCSAHHAKSICTRRQNRCRETISTLKKREKMLRSYQKVLSSIGRIAGGRETVSSDEEEAEDEDEECLTEAFSGHDIQEYVTNEQYLADKEIHRQKVKEHYRRKREQREKEETESQKKETSAEDIMQRLEELELEEEMSGELRTMDRSERSSAPAREIPPAKKKKKGGVKFAEDTAAEPKEEKKEAPEEEKKRTVKLGWTWNDGASNSSSSDEGTSTEPQNKTEAASSSPPRRLSFAQHLETGSDETSVIEFCHTPVDPLPSAALPSAKAAVAELKSPSDIYSTFQEMFAAAAPPKSILKQPTKEVDSSEQWPTLSYPFSYIQGDLPSSDSDYEQEATESEPVERPQVFGDVVEKIPVPVVAKVEEKKEAAVTKTKAATKKVGFASAEEAAAPSAKPTKKMSRFKSSRMKK